MKIVRDEVIWLQKAGMTLLKRHAALLKVSCARLRNLVPRAFPSRTDLKGKALRTCIR